MQPLVATPEEGSSTSSKVPPTQRALQVMGISLFLMTLVQTYVTIIGLASRYCTQEYDILVAGPLVVLICGFGVNGALGAWHYGLQQPFLAVLSTFGLEFFYVTLKHANSLRQCRPIEDLDRLQLRFGIWRSLPFAAMTFALSLRSILELTLCTAPATLSVIGQGLQVNNTLEWTKAIRDNDITVERLTRFHAFREDMNMSGVGDAELQEFREKFASLHDSLVGAFWKSCHCYKSKWKLKTGTFREDRSSRWAFSFFVTEDDDELGGIAQGKTLAGNILFNEMILDRLKMLNESAIEKIKGKIADLAPIFVTGWKDALKSLALQTASWPKIVDTIWKKLESPQSKFRKHGPFEAATFLEQSRAYPLPLLGWEGNWDLAKSSLGLLTSVMPVVKYVRKRRQVNFLWVVSHAIVDMILLVQTAICCITATSAAHAAGAFQAVAQAMVEQIVKGVASHQAESEFGEAYKTGTQTKTAQAMRQMLVRTVTQEAEHLGIQLTSAASDLMISPSQLLAAALTIFGFCIISAGLSHHLLKAPLSVQEHMNASVCGPLCFLGASAEYTKVCDTVRTLILLRSMLMTTILCVAWIVATSLSEVPMDFSIRFYPALMLNRSTWCVTLCAIWTTACVLHFVSGYLAVYAVEVSEEDKEDADPDGFDYEGLASAIEKSQEPRPPVVNAAYGTFTHP